MKDLKDKLLNTSIQQVADIFKKLKNDGFTLKEIEQMIFE